MRAAFIPPLSSFILFLCLPLPPHGSSLLPVFVLCLVPVAFLFFFLLPNAFFIFPFDAPISASRISG